MSSEPHFPLAPRLPLLQRTVLWTEMEVLQRGVARSWDPDKLQLSSEPKLLQTSRAAAKHLTPHAHRLVCTTWTIAPTSSIGLSRGNLSLRAGYGAVGWCLVPKLKVKETPCEAAQPQEAHVAGLHWWWHPPRSAADTNPSPCRSLARLQRQGLKGRHKPGVPAEPLQTATLRTGVAGATALPPPAGQPPGEGTSPWRGGMSHPRSDGFPAGTQSVEQGVRLPGNLNLSLVFCCRL